MSLNTPTPYWEPDETPTRNKQSVRLTMDISNDELMLDLKKGHEYDTTADAGMRLNKSVSIQP